MEIGEGIKALIGAGILMTTMTLTGFFLPNVLALMIKKNVLAIENKNVKFFLETRMLIGFCLLVGTIAASIFALIIN